MRFFNITGSCDPARHYMIPTEQRLPSCEALIAKGAYFVVHAPRQTGKTTAMKALARAAPASSVCRGASRELSPCPAHPLGHRLPAPARLDLRRDRRDRRPEPPIDLEPAPHRLRRSARRFPMVGDLVRDARCARLQSFHDGGTRKGSPQTPPWRRSRTARHVEPVQHQREVAPHRRSPRVSSTVSKG